MLYRTKTRHLTWLALIATLIGCSDDDPLTGPEGTPQVDDRPPVADGGLSFNEVTDSALVISWDAASDTVTAPNDLRYKVVKASSIEDIDTLSEIAAISSGSDLIQDFTAGATSVAVTGIESGRTYAFAVVVEDQAGNQAMYAPATQATPDDTNPIAGDAINFADITPNSLTVSWGHASDNVTGQAVLEYKLVRAASADSINSIDEVEAVTGSDLLLDYAQDVTSQEVTELNSSTSYAFAVVVRDEAGNRALYMPATGSTLDESAPSVGTVIHFAEVKATELEVRWGAATDDVTAQGSLTYKLVLASTKSQIDTLAEVDAIQSGPGLIVDFTAGKLSAIAKGLTSSTSYVFAVVVKDAAGNEALYSPQVQATSDVSPPTAGAAVSFASIADTSLSVQWGAAVDDVSAAANLQYKVVRAADGGSIDSVEEADAISSGADLVKDYTAALTTVDVSDLTPATQYYFAVIVRDEAGNRALYAPQNVTTLDFSAPTPGAAISFSDVSASGLTVNWGAATDDGTAQANIEYKLVRASSLSDIDTLDEVDAITSGPGLVFDFTANVTSHQLSGLTSSTAYAFAVLVRDAANNRALYSPSARYTSDVTAPTAGAGISFSNVTATTIKVHWGAASDDLTMVADLQYRLVMAEDAADIDTLEEAAAISGAGIIQNFTAAITSFEVTSLTGSQSYAFAIIVRDAAGNQALYAPGMQSTSDVVAPTVGAGVTFSNLISSSVTVNWGAASDDVTQSSDLEYKVVRAASASDIDTVDEADAISAGPGLVADYTANVTSVSATGLSALTSYAFAVVVRDDSGNRALYAPATTTTPDGTPPSVGTGLRFSSVTSTGFTSTWGIATDGVTAQSDLEYRLVRAATSAAIDTSTEVNAITGGDLLLDWTPNQLTYSVSGLSSGTFYFYAVAVRDSSHNVAVYPVNSRVTGRILYVSSNKHSSNLGGPSGADTFCGANRDLRASTDVSVGAVLAAGNTRRACTSANCTNASENVDWVLLANTTYYNTDGGVIGTTNGAGIFVFPATSAFSPGSTAYTYAGFNNNWTSNAANCSEFSEDASTGTLYLGRPAQSSVSAIWYANTLCSYSVSVVPIYVLCAER